MAVLFFTRFCYHIKMTVVFTTVCAVFCHPVEYKVFAQKKRVLSLGNLESFVSSLEIGHLGKSPVFWLLECELHLHCVLQMTMNDFGLFFFKKSQSVERNPFFVSDFGQIQLPLAKRGPFCSNWKGSFVRKAEHSVFRNVVYSRRT